MQAGPTKNSPTVNKDKEKHACDETTKEKSKIFKLRCRALLPEWLSTIDYDDKEEVLTIDVEQLVSGHILLIEVWNNNGVKYVGNFNELCQPIRKGGHILVQFLGSIAKEENYCPLSEKTWHELDQYFKGDIIKLIRDRFVIPNEEKYYTQALQRVDEVWRGYKHDLKKRYFKPAEKSIREICDNPANGVRKNNWVNLVKYWNSEKGKELSKIGKEARASLIQIHYFGGTSFANRRADYEDEHGEEMSLYELWHSCYRRKDGTFF
ncbi:uncharacterized protein LOC110694022 [Chenopodium quinoa]|uniref:uncharacterized protein LOC110694022 n=1 Tax=Chenopodium quinoa TaxID=63459 RepID=UPI000B76BEE1|nr:uncharacterized protein LOC110694022 [Chenopodium quinoa]XP_021726876.1 uncharacterized protein LOC110694022 [Chenopodium quinoa]